MKVLVTGSGRSGSWRIRGEQLGRAIGATVLPEAIDVAQYDVVILVKRPPPDLLARIHAARVPLIWDVVDAWPQPHGNEWPAQACFSWLRHSLLSVRPRAVVAATQQMARDAAAFGYLATCIPHHARPEQRTNPIRDRVALVGYDGGPQYIWRWSQTIKTECARRGWAWHPDPLPLEEMDIVLALRDQQGYAPLHWKSNVKLANAQATGTPVVCAREWGYLECAGREVHFADDQAQLSRAFDALADVETRRAISRDLIASASNYTLAAVAERYRAFLLGALS